MCQPNIYYQFETLKFNPETAKWENIVEKIGERHDSKRDCENEVSQFIRTLLEDGNKSRYYEFQKNDRTSLCLFDLDQKVIQIYEIIITTKVNNQE